MRTFAVLLAAALASSSVGCTRVDEPQAQATKDPTPPQPKKLSWTRAKTGDLAPIVVAHQAKAKAEGRVPLVYMGATWCEPCQHFHQAAERGELDATFGDLAILELDADLDKERAAKAGYTTTYIPLFVVPGPDGRGTEQKISGSVKGPGAVAELTPRLKHILGR